MEQPTLATVHTEFAAHKTESDRRHNEMYSRIERTEAKIDGVEKSKVSYKHFTWILGVLISLLLAMFGYISTQINDMSKNVSDAKTSIASVQGKLEPYNVQFKN